MDRKEARRKAQEKSTGTGYENDYRGEGFSAQI